MLQQSMPRVPAQRMLDHFFTLEMIYGNLPDMVNSFFDTFDLRSRSFPLALYSIYSFYSSRSIYVDRALYSFSV